MINGKEKDPSKECLLRSFLCCPTRTRTQTDRTRICSATITPLDNLSSDENHVPMLRVQRYLNFHSKQMFVEKKQRIEKTSYDIFHGVMMSYDIRGGLYVYRFCLERSLACCLWYACCCFCMSSNRCMNLDFFIFFGFLRFSCI